MRIPRWLKRTDPDIPTTRFHKHAGRLSDIELRTWGAVVAQHAAQRCELAALDPRDDVGEIRDAAQALAAVADELDKRTAAKRR